MPKVRFLGVTDQDRVLVDEAELDFDPRLSPTIRMRDKSNRLRHTDYQVVAKDSLTEIVAGAPEEACIIVYLREIR
ncbi:MAG: hypothetical protein ABW022_11495 [Actinoplanes sp.]